MTFIDGFVCAVPTANKQAYIDHAIEAWEVFKRHGALNMTECWGDDVLDGEVTSFPLAVKAGDDETVVFSWITWPSKAVRDEGWPKIMQDPAMSMADMPFDGKRMIYGGFTPIVKV